LYVEYGIVNKWTNISNPIHDSPPKDTASHLTEHETEQTIRKSTKTNKKIIAILSYIILLISLLICIQYPLSNVLSCKNIWS